MGIVFIDDDWEGLIMFEIFFYFCFLYFVLCIDGCFIDFDKIECVIEELSCCYDVVLFEGVGGLMVLFIDELFMIDYIV